MTVPVTGGGEVVGLGGVAVRLDLDAGVVQVQGAGVALRRGDLHLCLQRLEDLGHVVGLAGPGDRLGVGPVSYTHLTLPTNSLV